MKSLSRFFCTTNRVSIVQRQLHSRNQTPQACPYEIENGGRLELQRWMNDDESNPIYADITDCKSVYFHDEDCTLSHEDLLRIERQGRVQFIYGRS